MEMCHSASIFDPVCNQWQMLPTYFTLQKIILAACMRILFHRIKVKILKVQGIKNLSCSLHLSCLLDCIYLKMSSAACQKFQDIF